MASVWKHTGFPFWYVFRRRLMFSFPHNQETHWNINDAHKWLLEVAVLLHGGFPVYSVWELKTEHAGKKLKPPEIKISLTQWSTLYSVLNPRSSPIGPHLWWSSWSRTQSVLITHLPCFGGLNPMARGAFLTKVLVKAACQINKWKNKQTCAHVSEEWQRWEAFMLKGFAWNK